jgi:hypothetical protein
MIECLEGRTLMSATEFSAADSMTAPETETTTIAYSSWFTCLKSCADSKGQVQGELARFR